MNTHEQNLTSIKTYLEGIIAVCKGKIKHLEAYSKLILEQGKAFHEVVSSDSMEITKAWRKARKPKIKECFYNSQLFVSTEVGEYYEGYCMDGLIPFHHGWVVIDGKVIDFTLEARDRSLKRQKMKNNANNAAYLGVMVPKCAIVENIVKFGVAEPIAQKHYLKSEARFL